MGYPDPTNSGWVRTEELEVSGFHIRMTVAPGEKIVELWELVDGEPGRWFGNVFRLDTKTPSHYLNYELDKHLGRAEREMLVSRASKFWKSLGPKASSARIRPVSGPSGPSHVDGPRTGRVVRGPSSPVVSWSCR
ncbi:hypothetical protein [Glycomyces xiaoerkulensis]|uniref:hypothetical protein n=1 Tax=Glycomyces xiaoerkulensis TaxID=2038139 RepID=UPI0012FFFDC0|nr:hypothetical protein [Glycomyces xiaoerkulensis]